MSEPFVCAYTGRWLAGVDEAGRGPLVGDVVAAAVVLDPARPLDGLADSKRLTARRREQLCEAIQSRALAWGIGRASPADIDALNILQASLLAMERAVGALASTPEYVLVDGNRTPDWIYPSEAVVQGDSRHPAISAASILAKVARDADMAALEACYPGYGFQKHKGYPTREHLAALERLGPTPLHRRSFGPVRRLLETAGGRG